jgi:short-subunit dehydrogenase
MPQSANPRAASPQAPSAHDDIDPSDGAPALSLQSIVLTGASSGIGRATALALASRGASLTLAARNLPVLQDIAAECEAAGGRAQAVQTDVTDAAAVASLAQAAIARFGKVDAWINNVGVGAVGAFEQTPIEAHRRVVEANLLGHIHGSHAIVPHFRARGRGTLVQMISLGGWVAAPYAASYAASKFGLRGFSESLRAELSDLPHVHVCEVFPTFVDTPGISHGANFSGRHVRPPPPVVDPRRVARAVVSLLVRPRARTYVGAPALPAILAHAAAPNLVARGLKRSMDKALQRARPAAHTQGNLFEASRGNAVDGGFRRPASGPGAAALGMAVAAGAASLACVWLMRRGARP